MSIRQSDAFVLRTFPFGEADLIVSFFTRDAGKLRGVAKRARKHKSGFGASMDRMSMVRVSYYHRENRELVYLRTADILAPVFSLSSNYDVGLALDYISELSEQLLPAEEPNDRFFRLLDTAVTYLRDRGDAGIWPAVTYFTFWSVRLSGFLPLLSLRDESRELAARMLATNLRDLNVAAWTRDTGADLRRVLLRSIEDHLERRLLTPRLLDSL